ncbi:AraC family transcriptional regulator [Neorhizobium sp. NCHU2750]|uniref:helix-turn-helix domain-containing protein n=1 Tax=Neorhizobium sp. NCHU2750 TaxID=1825976 RepID=UPI000E710356|nr:AraC family transcriptional regulator [Neorhizobium sp. NCHU2750]
MSATAAVVARQIHALDMSGSSCAEQVAAQTRRSAALRIVAADMPEISDLPQGTTGGLAPWQVKKIRQHIEARIGHGIPLDELAQLVRLSTSYFSSAFKSTFGVSPHSYIVCCRVDHAKYRMLTSDAPLCEIALDCGLADQSHLSRVFRRVTGTTPSAWRRHACMSPRDRLSALVALQ